jgi:5-(carboxyamino)imidazole ribonucleotide synthase
LKSEGKVVHPNPDSLEIIQDKGLQKMFYKTNQIPTTDFIIFENKLSILNAIENKLIKFPFVQKTRKDGYDGRGVCVVNTESDLANLLEGPCLVEDKVEISVELAVIAARNEQGEIVVYDPVSMEFHDGANMLDLLLYPAPIDRSIAEKAQQIAKQLITQFDICGLLAVEFLIDKQNNIWVNEVAPRAHNSGHQTIESSFTSQYQQHLRAILNLPLGSTEIIMPSAMVNILGAEGNTGNVYYEGIEECLQEEGVFIHIYGKKITKPFRKMGHATIINQNLNEAKNKALWVRQILQAKSH